MWQKELHHYCCYLIPEAKTFLCYNPFVPNEMFLNWYHSSASNCIFWYNFTFNISRAFIMLGNGDRNSYLILLWARNKIQQDIITYLHCSVLLVFVILHDKCHWLLCFEISDKLSPPAFEKHSGRETTGKWRNTVWVMVQGEKVPLSKTVLLKYYYLAQKSTNGSHKGRNGRPSHRDEFIRCTSCGKERRFRLRSQDECRIYHDALAKVNWTCEDLPTDR
jgi:hypothetical protein